MFILCDFGGFLVWCVMMFLVPGLSLQRASLQDTVNVHGITASE